MPSKRMAQSRESTPSASSDSGSEGDLDQPPTEIEPYTVLGIEKSATSEQIKSAYRRAALKHHPDKAPSEQREEANKRFQEVAFAYAILSDEKRRKRYDSTGNTSEAVDDDDFDWLDFFREQTQAMVTEEMLNKIKAEYQNSNEEREAVLGAYKDSKGDMNYVHETVMCSTVLDDDKRFRDMIDEAIQNKEVPAFKRYTQESTKSKQKRVKQAQDEASEAAKLAKELGLTDKLAKAKKGGSGEDELKALIQARQKDRASTFLENLEAKYGGGGGGRGKRKQEEPSEELFAPNSKKGKKAR